MDPLFIGLIAIGIMLVLIALSVPIAVSMLLVSFGGIVILDGFNIGVSTLTSTAFWLSASYTFAVIPLFIFMGSLAADSGIAFHTYRLAAAIVGRVRGVLAFATTIAATLFAACCGSSIASAVTFTRVALPQMLDYKHDGGFCIGLIAAGGTMACMIPPSASMVIFAVLTEVSLGRLFIAGIVPGIINGVLLAICIAIILRFRPGYAPKIQLPPLSLREKLESLTGSLGIVSLFLLVMGGIYLGIFTPSQAGAVGACGALVLFFVFVRHHIPQRFATTINEAVLSSAQIFIIIIGGFLFTRFLIRILFISSLIEWMHAVGLTPMLVLGMFCIIYIILGMFMSPSGILVMLVPVFYPTLIALGFDGIWLGIISVKLVELGTTTPPIGMTLFAAVAAAEGRVRLEEAYKRILLFLPVDFIILGLIIAFPQLSLWLPGTMK